MAESRLYFTIGPVQTFVSQSRRTRDLWASSFLLSHLADVAMKAVEGKFGEIILPDRTPEDHAIESGQIPHGRWPNRFVLAHVPEAKAKDAADAAQTAFLDEWTSISQRIWKEFVEPIAAQGKETSAIWQRQVYHFWEITWVYAPPASDEQPDALACRKNWRTTPVTVEPGDHCTIIGNLQELSGFIRSRESKRQDEFWKALRTQKKMKGLDLGDHERLCAVAFVKRMFPKVADEILNKQMSAERWLSTPYIAAIPWLKNVCHSHLDDVRTYLAKVKELCADNSWRREDPGTLTQHWNLPTGCEEVVRLDGDLLHETALVNRDTPIGEPGAEDQRKRAELLKALQVLQKRVDSQPSSFYSVVLMDGDSMGKLLSEARGRDPQKGEKSATRALGKFAQTVPGIVGEHDGVTVYCGGDDVLALVPVDSALRCVQSLSRAYQTAFSERSPDYSSKATISAAIVFCSFRAPFREVIGLAHHLLDDIAKERTGRDSLAVAVLKSGGVTCQWAAPWNVLSDGDMTVLDSLVECLRGSDERSGNLSSGILHQIRDRFASLTNDPLKEPGRFGELPEEIDIEPVLVGEYRRTQGRWDDASSSESAALFPDNTIQLLLKVCRRSRRTAEGETRTDKRSLGIDGPLLVRFLSKETRRPCHEEKIP